MSKKKQTISEALKWRLSNALLKKIRESRLPFKDDKRIPGSLCGMIRDIIDTINKEVVNEREMCKLSYTGLREHEDWDVDSRSVTVPDT